MAGNLNQYHFQYFAPYIQDDWKVTNRLTLNLGLRWDYRTVPFEQDNKMFWFDRANPGGGLCYADKDSGHRKCYRTGWPDRARRQRLLPVLRPQQSRRMLRKSHLLPGLASPIG